MEGQPRRFVALLLRKTVGTSFFFAVS